jgi:hypothetical protein
MFTPSKKTSLPTCTAAAAADEVDVHASEEEVVTFHGDRGGLLPDLTGRALQRLDLGLQRRDPVRQSRVVVEAVRASRTFHLGAARQHT